MRKITLAICVVLTVGCLFWAAVEHDLARKVERNERENELIMKAVHVGWHSRDAGFDWVTVSNIVVENLK